MERATEEVFETPDTAADDGSSNPSSSTSSSARPYSASQGNGSVNSDPENLMPNPLHPDAAFEVFHGKRYDTSSLTDLSGSIAPRPVSSSQRRRREREQQGGGGGRAGGNDDEETPETPVERYLRLKVEASELMEEVEALVAVQDEKCQHVEAASLWKHLANEVSTLKGDLLTLAEGPERAQLLTRRGNEDGDDADISSVAAEADLAEALVRKVDELTNKSSSSSSSTGSSNNKASTDSSEPKEGSSSSGGVVYELYYDAANTSSSSSSSSRRGLRASSAPQLQVLESRLAALEKLLLLSDSNSSSSSSSGEQSITGLVLSTRALPLVEALAKVERQATLLDAGAIETLRQRLVLLKNEWDEFKKERLKLANSLDRDAGSHFRRVESVWEIMGRVGPVVGDLPHFGESIESATGAAW